MPIPTQVAPEGFLEGDDIVDTQDPDVARFAKWLRSHSSSVEEFSRSAFEWVRDEVAHSWDAQDPRSTITASEVLRQRVGLCYAKSHLLAALLRSEGVPCALAYQRLNDESFGYMLHGLVAVHIHGRWHRQDPRGNKPGIDAQFSLGDERLAWVVREDAGEIDYPGLYLQPAQGVVEALRSTDDVLTLYRGRLPAGL